MPTCARAWRALRSNGVTAWQPDPSVTPEARPRALNIEGEHLTVLASKQATGGAYEIFLREGPEGSGPPPHQHTRDESVLVFEGQVDFGYDDQQLTATAGTLVHLPAGTVRWFRFGPGGARMLSMTGVGSNAAALFAADDAQIRGGEVDVEKLIATGERQELHCG